MCVCVCVCVIVEESLIDTLLPVIFSVMMTSPDLTEHYMKQLVSVKEDTQAEPARILSRPLDAFSLEDQQRLQPVDDEFQAWVKWLGHVPFFRRSCLSYQACVIC